jgi:hypothetical protein
MKHLGTTAQNIFIYSNNSQKKKSFKQTITKINITGSHPVKLTGLSPAEPAQ